MNRFVALCIVVGSLLPLISLRVAWAQGEHGFPLMVEVEPSSYFTRTGGPTPLALKATWGGGGVLKGNLELQIHNGQELLGSFVQRDLFINGEQRFQLLVPPLTTDYVGGFLQVSLWFTQDGTSYRLPDQQLRMTATDGRKFVVTLCVPEAELERNSDDLNSDLEFDVLQPAVDPSDPRRTQDLTVVNRIAVEMLPTSALEHCVRNVLAMNGTAWARINSNQRTALIAWVRAGGSLYIQLDDTVQPAAQLADLNQLAATDLNALTFLPSSTGGPQLSSAADADGPLLRRFGLGHVVLISQEMTVSAIMQERTVVPFLWNVRSDQARAIELDGKWSFAVAAGQFNDQQYGGYGEHDLGYRQQMAGLRPIPVAGGIGLIRSLMPRGFSLVPLWLIGLVLAAFILVVGPIDYLWLGMFSSRKWTWISFPVMTLVFTAFALVVSNSYMRANEQRGRIVIRDVVDGNLIARETELQLLFNNSSGVVETNVQSALFTPLVYQQFGSENEDWSVQQARQNLERGGNVGPPVIVGSMPRQAFVQQSVPQWTPQLNRLFRISNAPLPEASGFDWDADIAWDAPADLSQRIRSAFGPSATALLYRSSRGTLKSGAFEKRILQGAEHVLPEAVNERYEQVQLLNGSWTSQLVSHDFITEISLRTPRGLFGVVSQTAPSCGDQLEDLTLLDPSDSNDLLLLVSFRDAEGTLQVLRRMYRIP